jgi:hypothetical protein
LQASRGTRRGRNFTIRASDAEHEALATVRAQLGGPRALGPWLIWAGLRAAPPALPELAAVPRAVPGKNAYGFFLPGARVILDLCGGSGAWSRPYAAAGYDVRVVTLPALDVRTYAPPGHVWGVLAAPPCAEFSMAKRAPRDFAAGLETVVACLRVIGLCRPRWWALENPGSGLLRRWLGAPRDTFQPCDFGDPWTKLTALWGDFRLPVRAPVAPRGRMPGETAAARAVTPRGFAEAFCAANP